MTRIFPVVLESVKARVKDEDAYESENFAPRQIDLSRNPIAAPCMFPAFFSFSSTPHPHVKPDKTSFDGVLKFSRRLAPWSLAPDQSDFLQQIRFYSPWLLLGTYITRNLILLIVFDTR